MKALYMAVVMLCISVSIVFSNTRVFILSGQSNMVGIAKVSSLTEDEKTEYAFDNSEIYVSMQDDLYKPPDTRDETYAPQVRGPYEMKPGETGLLPAYHFIQPEEISFGPELGIAKVLREKYPSDKLIFIKVAMGGSSLHHLVTPYHWLTAENEPAGLLNAFFDRVAEAFTLISSTDPGYTIDGFIWMQGESDAGDNKDVAGVYTEKLTRFAELIRQRWPGIPFVYGMIHNERFINDAGSKQDYLATGRVVQIQQVRAQTVIPNCRCTDKTAGEDATVYQGTVHPFYCYVHYDKDGMLNVGKFLGEAMVDRINGVNTRGCSSKILTVMQIVRKQITDSEDETTP